MLLNSEVILPILQTIILLQLRSNFLRHQLKKFTLFWKMRDYEYQCNTAFKIKCIRGLGCVSRVLVCKSLEFLRKVDAEVLGPA